MTRSLILMLSAWIVATAWLNFPLLPGILTAPEGYAWPALIVLACLWLAVAIVLGLLRATTPDALPAAVMAALTLGLALRLWLLPIGTPPSPLALVGVREILSIFAACYAAFAAWQFRKRRAA